MVDRARELRGGLDGMTYPEIRDQLGAEFGQRPSVDTITGWCDPKRLAVKRRNQRDWMRGRRRERGQMPTSTVDGKALVLAERLYRRNVAMDAIGVVLDEVYGVALNAREVRGLLAHLPARARDLRGRRREEMVA